MFHLLKQSVLAFAALALLVTAAKAEEAKVGSCHVSTGQRAMDEAYTIEFPAEFELKEVSSNDNYYAQVQAGRAFGCVIFAVSQSEGKLKGKYQAVYTEGLNSKCPGKADYVYTQFRPVEKNGSLGKRTFRLQCQRPVFADVIDGDFDVEVPAPFAPSLSQAKQINFEKVAPGKRTVKVEVVN